MQGLDVEIIAPLHGPVLKSELDYYINKYNIWSTYSPEDIGYTVCYSTIHGNTRKAAEYVASILDEKGIIYELFDLSNCDVAEVVESAFRYDKMLLLGVTYDGGLMPCMQDMFYHFKMKNVQNRKVGLIQNGTWGPLAGKLMKEQLEGLKNMTILDKVITIKSVMTEANKAEIKELIDTMN
jgi:flavorubredoxin